MQTFFILFLAMMLVSCTALTESPEPTAQPTATTEPLSVQTQTARSEDSIKMTETADTAVFDIHSPTGIGQADVRRQTGSWPPTVRLAFHLNGLEEMRLQYADVLITVNLSSLEGNELHQSVTQQNNNRTLTADSPYWLDVTLVNEDGTPGTVPLKNGRIELTLPADFYETAPADFSVSWIDFYR